MTPTGIADRLVYLDKEFVSIAYEDQSGKSPETKITRSEGLNAGLRMPILSAGASSVESKTFSVSTFGMLRELLAGFEAYPQFTQIDHSIGSPSVIGWVEGHFTVNKVTVKRSRYTLTIVGTPKEPNEDDKEKIVAEENYFKIILKDSQKGGFALVTTADYFSSGLDALMQLSDTIVGQIRVPVRALLRVFSAKSPFDEWVAVPLLILEQER